MQNESIRRWLPALLAATLFVPACTDSGEGPVLAIDASGAIFGRAYLDVNGNGTVDLTDGSVADLRLGLLLLSGRDTAATATTASDGSFALPRVPVGDYELVVDSATVPDSLRLIEIDSARLTLGAADTLGILVELSYPTVSVDSARALRAGTTVFIEGVALHYGATFGGQVLHLADSTGAIRTRVSFAAGVRAGDSIRIRGTRSQRNGQPILQNAAVFILGSALLPPEPVDTLTTAEAATADNGRLDAALVRIRNAVVEKDTTTLTNERRLTVDDGSGPLTVVIDPDTGIDVAEDLVDATLDATGILVPAEDLAGTWWLKPRSNEDREITLPPPPDAAQATRRSLIVWRTRATPLRPLAISRD